MRPSSLVVGTCLVACLAGQGTPLPPRSDVDMVLLQPYLDDVPVGDGIEAFPTTRGVLVPLGELCRLLAFGIRVDASQGRAEGFFIAEKRRFLLDLGQGQVESEGRRKALAPGSVEQHARDLFVDANLLAEWFPLQVQVDLKGSALVLKAKEKLPIQELWERDRRFGNEGLRRYGDDPGGPAGRPTAIPYAFVDVPFVDLSLNASRASGQTETQASGTVSLAGDLFWMSSSLYASRDPDGAWRNARATLFREDPQGGMLGPLHARRVALGDLQTSPTLELAGGLPQGRGLSLDNYPVAYRTRFASRTFRGSLPEGWTVEFFQNGGLVGFQRSRLDGLYEFTEVPLRFGLNQFRLVFHGPQGQVREESQRLDISQDQPPPGSFFYGLTAMRPTLLPSAAVSLPANPEDLKRPAYLANFEYGLTSSLALQAGASRLHLADGSHTYGVMGLQGIFPYVALQLTGAQDQNGTRNPGRAAQGVLRTGLGYSSLTLRRAEYRGGFQRNAYGGTSLAGLERQIRSSYGVDLSATGSFSRIPLSLTLTVDEEAFTNGTEARRDRAQIGSQLAGLNLSVALSRLKDTFLPGSPMEGSLLVSRFWSKFSFQGELVTQRTLGSTQVKGWNTLGEYRTDSGIQFRAGLRGTGPGGGPPTAMAGIIQSTGRFGFGLDYQRTKDNSSISFRLQVSLGRDPNTGRIVSDAMPMTNQGAVSARAFLDANGNGRLDPGEEVLEGTRFKVGESQAAKQVDDPRVSFISQLPRGQELDVSLDVSSLPEAAQQPTVKAYRIVPRPGKVARLDVPVSTFGEVTGTTRIRRGGKTEELPGLEIELCKASGERLKVLRSGYDGYFEFRDLAHGDYLLRVTAQETARVKLLLAPPRTFRVDDRRNILDGLDLVVTSAVEVAQQPVSRTPQSVPVEPPGPPKAPPPAPLAVPSAPAEPPPSPTAPTGLKEAAPRPSPTQLPEVNPSLMAPTGPPTSQLVSQGDWTVLLVVAYKESTLEVARQELGPRAKDVFTRDLPKTQSSRRSRQICFGRFASADEARQAASTLPPHFFWGGNRPRELHIPSSSSNRSTP